MCPVCLTVVILFVPFGRLTTECANGYQGPFTYHPLVQINSHFYIYGNPWSTWNLHIERVLNRRYTLVCWFSASSIHISLVLAIHMKLLVYQIKHRVSQKSTNSPREKQQAKAMGNYTHGCHREGTYSSSQCAGNESRLELCRMQGCVYTYQIISQ